jgi:hypothetical protein
MIRLNSSLIVFLKAVSKPFRCVGRRKRSSSGQRPRQRN